MNNEQRMREQFEKWLVERGLTDEVWLQDPYTSWSIDDMYDVYRARDAEVQALRKALESVHYRATRWEVLPTVEAHQSVLRDIGEDARAALAGGEEGEAE